MEDAAGSPTTAWSRSLNHCTANPQGVAELRARASGNHQWTSSSHHRPTFCNFCREKLSGVPWHGMACEVCKIKTHKRCALQLTDPCKWSVLDSVPAHLQYVTPENTVGPHQWIQGNLPMGSRCCVCEKACGSVLKLQDQRCVWCGFCVHDSCVSAASRLCLLGSLSLSVLPPLAVEGVDPDGKARIRMEAIGGDCGGGSPLLVLVNSKSGDNQGQRLIRKLRRLLNPIQIFDLIACGPDFPLTFFSQFDSFRVLVCSGDGTVGWVFSALDRLNLLAKCQLGIIPLGTGNDLARVLGWGHAFYNDARLPNLLRTYERAHTRMLDRWSVLACEGVVEDSHVFLMEHDVAAKVVAVMEAEEISHVVRAVKELCVVVKMLMEQLQTTYSVVENWEKEYGHQSDDPLTAKCQSLLARLDPLMKDLDEWTTWDESGVDSSETIDEEERARRERLVQRANSLKKALKDMLQIAEGSIERSALVATAPVKRERFRKKRSKTTPSVLKVTGASTLSSSSANTPPASPSGGGAPRFEGGSVSAGTFLKVTDRPRRGLRSATSLGEKQISREAEADEGEDGDDDEMEEEEDAAKRKTSCQVGIVQPPTPSSGRRRLAENESASRPSRTGATTRCFARIGSGADELRQSHSDSSIYDHSAADSGATSGSPYNAGAKNEISLNILVKDKQKQTLIERLPALKRGILSSGLTGGSLIAEILLLNANVHREHTNSDDQRRKFGELKVMNNYFGIGLDAKIALDFHNKREESDKTRSRSKLFMWYGILGGKELVHRTYRNLNERIRLECDGLPIDLPSLQGIVILNIPSYSGGANFWGDGHDENFTIQSYDDKVLEVVALFGVIHVASSRVPNVVRLQNHRIAQCRHVKITIYGDESIPVQVDGEPWLQPPGVLQIVHKNRAQLLVKNAQSFDASLRLWEEHKSTTAPSTPTALSFSIPIEPIGGDQIPFFHRAAAFVSTIESEMAHLGLTAKFLDTLQETASIVRRAELEADEQHDATRIGHSGGGGSGGGGATADTTGASLPSGPLASTEADRLSLREEVVAAVELIADQLESHLGCPSGGVQRTIRPVPLADAAEAGSSTSSAAPSALLPPADQTKPSQFNFEGESTNWRFLINSVRQELQKEEAAIKEGREAERSQTDEESRGGSRGGKARSFARWIRNKLRRKRHPYKNAPNWTTDEVSNFLGSIGLSAYAPQFITNEITGRELIHLERQDILELGVVKLGHSKRLQNAIAEIRENVAALEVRKLSRRQKRGGVSDELPSSTSLTTTTAATAPSSAAPTPIPGASSGVRASAEHLAPGTVGGGKKTKSPAVFTRRADPDPPSTDPSQSSY